MINAQFFFFLSGYLTEKTRQDATWQAAIIFRAFFVGCFVVRVNQALISATEVKPSGSAALYCLLDDAQLFLLPQCVPHIEHSDTSKHDNHGVLHSQKFDSHAAGEKCGRATPS